MTFVHMDINTRTLQTHLGHRSIKSTPRYATPAPGRFKNIWGVVKLGLRTTDIDNVIRPAILAIEREGHDSCVKLDGPRQDQAQAYMLRRRCGYALANKGIDTRTLQAILAIVRSTRPRAMPRWLRGGSRTFG
jgi:hypothetical protein